MKKLTYILFLIIFSSHITYAQPKGNAYADATKFIELIQPGASEDNLKELVSIVAYYSDKADINISNIGTTLGTMPFLSTYQTKVTGIINSLPVRLAPDPNLTGVPSGVGNSLMGMDVTNIADGVAKFLIERGKQELSMAFFDRFREDLQKFPELTYLFPVSTEIIKNIESYNIQGLLQELKDAFVKDLLNMPNNILSLRNINVSACSGNVNCIGRVSAINTAFAIAPPVGDSRFLILPLIVMQGIIDGNSIIEISNKMGSDASICGKADNLSGFIQVCSILIESLRTEDSEGGLFLSQDKLKNLFFSKDLLNAFLGLVYQKYNSSGFTCYNSTSIAGHNLQGIFSLILDGRSRFYSAMTSFDKINSAFTNIKKSTRDGRKLESAYYASAISSSITMLSNITDAIEVLIPGSFPAGFNRVNSNLNLASQICSDIQRKNYAGIFNNTIKLISDNKVIPDNDSRAKLIKYLSFAANLAAASNSDEVKEAINSIALPPGSYSIKQKSEFNISFNGYIGYAWDFNHGLFASGVSAPLGFSASLGLGRKYGGAVTLFGSLIDVGSIVAYRLKNGTTDTLKQEIRLESIVSPSVQLLFEIIPKTPIAFGFGWRKTAKLFYKNQTDFIGVPPKDVFNISVLIDIPIFTIKNTSYK